MIKEDVLSLMDAMVTMMENDMGHIVPIKSEKGRFHYGISALTMMCHDYTGCCFCRNDNYSHVKAAITMK